ncbi:MAG: MFS transporter [Clostridia bacterium]|nr:MFS transporter [Clostridia bacterium]
MDSKPKQQKNTQKWVNVAMCAIMIFTCLGFCSSNKSLYLSAITDALDIKRSAYSLATSCRYISTSIINIFFGTLVYKFGTKKLMLSGFVLLIVSMLLNSVATSVVMFCISEAISGIAFSWSGTAMVGGIINRWCKENTGTVMGAVLAANGIGGALAAQIVTPIIYQEGTAFGYRDAYRLVALILLVVGILVAIFFKEKPRGEIDDSPSPTRKKARGRSWVGIDYNAAKKKGFFYGAAICIFLTGMCLQGVGSVASAHLLDKGIATALVATVASVSSLLLTCSKFLTGFLYDKLGLRKTISICCVASVLTMLSLAFMDNSSLGTALAFIYAIVHAVALPLETVMLPLYAKDLFGETSYNKVMGMFVSINTAGYAIGGPLINLGYDLFGTYIPMFYLTSGIMLAVLIGLQFVITAAHKEQKLIVSAQESVNA